MLNKRSKRNLKKKKIFLNKKKKRLARQVLDVPANNISVLKEMLTNVSVCIIFRAALNNELENCASKT